MTNRKIALFLFLLSLLNGCAFFKFEKETRVSGITAIIRQGYYDSMFGEKPQMHEGICAVCGKTYQLTDDDLKYPNINCPRCGYPEYPYDALERYTAHLEKEGLKIGEPKMRYLGLGGNHWIADLSGGGAYIKLEDGSLWKLSDSDRAETLTWFVADSITVTENGDSIYSYTLVNYNSGNAAGASPVSLGEMMRTG